jgi:tetratricopeptide (TPR) repeat protein
VQFEQALAIQYKLMLASPASKEYRTDLAATENNFGLLLSQAGDHLQAADRFRRAIRIQENVRCDSPDDESVLNALAASYNNLSSLYTTSDLPLAQRWIEQAMSLQLKLVLEHPRKLRCSMHSYQHKGR